MVTALECDSYIVSYITPANDPCTTVIGSESCLIKITA
jgi:hypothetical protein